MAFVPPPSEEMPPGFPLAPFDMHGAPLKVGALIRIDKIPESLAHDLPREEAFHMNEFTQIARKAVLERLGEPRNYRYRFTDPLLQPFVIMKGLADGMIDDVTAEVYASRWQGQLSTSW